MFHLRQQTVNASQSWFRAFLISFPLLTTASGVLAADMYYVAKSGDDANNCSQTQPCFTLQRGVSQLQPGDTLNIGAGIYSDIGSSSTYFNGGTTENGTTPKVSDWLIAFDRSGTRDNPITIQADPANQGEVILDGGYLGVESANRVGGIMIRHHDYIHFKNFTIRNVSAAGIYNWDHEGEVEDPDHISYGVVIEDMTIHHVGNVDNLAAIGMWSSKDWIVRNNHIYDVYRDHEKDYGKKGAGIQSYGTINALIEHNLFEDVGSGIFLKDHYVINAETRAPVFESEIRFNLIRATRSGVQIGVQPQTEAGANYIHHNIVHTTGKTAKAILYNMAAVSEPTTAPQRVEHNLLYGENSKDTTAIRLSGVADVSVKGNIISGYNKVLNSVYITNHPAGLSDSDYNIFAANGKMAFLDAYSASGGYTPVSYTSLASWQTALASGSVTLKFDHPDTHSLSSSVTDLFSELNTFAYADNSPATALMEDGSNAGPYQTGNEVIGINKGSLYYVAKSGNDSDDCSQTYPCLTLQKGISLLQPGDTLNIGTGVYSDIGSLSPYFSGDTSGIVENGTVPKVYDWLIAMDRSGTKDHPITIQADPANSGDVILDGGYLGAASSHLVGGITIRHNDYIHFKNFTIRNVAAAGIYNWDHEGEVEDPDHISYGVVIEDMTIHHVGNVDNLAAIGMWSSKDWIVRNNHIYDVYRDHEKDYGKKGAGIQSYGTINALIEHNLFEDVGSGIFLKDHYVINAETRAPVFESEIRFNLIRATRSGVQIGVQPETEAGANYIHHNIVHTTGKTAKAILYNMAAVSEPTTAPQRVEQNLLYGENSKDTLGIRINGISDLMVKGNIIVGYKNIFGSQDVDNEPAKLNSSDYNIFAPTQKIAYFDASSVGYQPVSYTSLTSWQAALVSSSFTLNTDYPDTHSLRSSADALFQNLTTFTYPEDSPAIGLMPDGSNAGPYQIGNEIIGL
ncbi:hypothetical protein VA7868_00176 [Vibrio aerogenes CECT 7868]|uniref:Right handed beta helix domain-containing protein n=1 Tax=Vibrio aerogenes CECT 7868 TaxID=1216006 RepID=A0A1M5UU65_9VIBR|nr:right-handed parallel beta-helix repeat-containing protein [Vibrio aerogenes]SHH66511.1 hypothetical protein VA7868_00176 [Vibrio aerogenes CECT 7868]